MPGRTNDIHESDSVGVEVTGRDHAQLRERALRDACKFFGVRIEDAALDTRTFHAEPHMRHANGEVAAYKAVIVVYRRPEDDESTDSGDDDDVTSAEELEQTVTPPRTSRAIGPLGEEEWSDEEYDDEEGEDDD